jgi:hypothetical protein
MPEENSLFLTMNYGFCLKIVQNDESEGFAGVGALPNLVFYIVVHRFRGYQSVP